MFVALIFCVLCALMLSFDLFPCHGRSTSQRYQPAFPSPASRRYGNSNCEPHPYTDRTEGEAAAKATNGEFNFRKFCPKCRKVLTPGNSWHKLKQRQILSQSNKVITEKPCPAYRNRNASSASGGKPSYPGEVPSAPQLGFIFIAF